MFGMCSYSRAAALATIWLCVLSCAAIAEDEPKDGKRNQTTGELPRGALPWKNAKPTGNAVAELTGPRDVLAKFDIDDRELGKLVDWQPYSSAPPSTLLKILFRLPFFTRENVERWAQSAFPWDDVKANPEKYRTAFYSLRGNVTRAVPVAVPAESPLSVEFAFYWELTLRIEGLETDAIVLARNAPRAWKDAESLDEPVQIFGLLLRVAADGMESAPRPVFAADRIAWHPRVANDELGVAKDHVYLAGLGVDIGQLENIDDRSTKESITSAEWECFCQLLDAVGRAEPPQLNRHSGPFDLAALLTRPESQRGRIVDVAGNARQVMKIMVDDEETRRRLGIDHYYQIDLFVPLEKTVRIVDRADSNKKIDYEDRYPVTVCVRHLPPELSEPGKPNVYQAINQQIRVPAVYFKVWSITTERMRRLGGDRRQSNPMFIGREVQVVSIDTSTNPVVSIGVGMAFIVALAAIWIAVWRSTRSDKRFEENTLKRQFEVEEGQSLDDQGIESQDRPDFSSLD